MKNNKLNPTIVKISAVSILFTTVLFTLGILFHQPTSANQSVDSYTFLPAIYKPYTTFTPIPLDVTFDYVTDIVNAGDDRLFLGERSGLIYVMQSTGEKSVFLDIRNRVLDTGAEQGFFSIAFHPNYVNNGYFFVSYTGEPTEDNSTGKLIVSRFQVSGDPNVANPSSETVVFSKSEIFTIHNGGGIRFHPNGHLYLGVGDDTNTGAAQASADVRGKILRLEVDNMTTNVVNQFNAEVKAPMHIVARGLRNPWRIGIDTRSGEIYIGDVGNRKYEEVNLMNADWDGWNFGWPCYEGPNKETNDCGNSSLIEPIFYYPHGVGQPFKGCFVTAGEMNYNQTYFTNGSQFIIADGCERVFYAIYREKGEWKVELMGKIEGVEGLLTAIGKDAAGNLYAGTLWNDMPLHKLIIP